MAGHSKVSYVEKATYFVDVLHGFREVSLTPGSQGGVDIILDGVTYCSNLQITNNYFSNSCRIVAFLKMFGKNY